MQYLAPNLRGIRQECTYVGIFLLLGTLRVPWVCPLIISFHRGNTSNYARRTIQVKFDWSVDVPGHDSRFTAVNAQTFDRLKLSLDAALKAEIWCRWIPWHRGDLSPLGSFFHKPYVACFVFVGQVSLSLKSLSHPNAAFRTRLSNLFGWTSSGVSLVWMTLSTLELVQMSKIYNIIVSHHEFAFQFLSTVTIFTPLLILQPLFPKSTNPNKPII